MGNWAQYYIPAVAAIGTAMYGIDTGIIATTIGHASFKEHMFPPDGEDAALIGKPRPPTTPISSLELTLSIAQVPSSPCTMLGRPLEPCSPAGPPTDSAEDIPLQLQAPSPSWGSYCL